MQGGGGRGGSVYQGTPSHSPPRPALSHVVKEVTEPARGSDRQVKREDIGKGRTRQVYPCSVTESAGLLEALHRSLMSCQPRSYGTTAAWRFRHTLSSNLLISHDQAAVNCSHSFHSGG